MNRDYTKRSNVIRYAQWWRKKIDSKEWTLEHCISLLKAGKTTYMDRKDRSDLIQVLEAEYGLANVQA